MCINKCKVNSHTITLVSNYGERFTFLSVSEENGSNGRYVNFNLKCFIIIITLSHIGKFCTSVFYTPIYNPLKQIKYIRTVYKLQAII